MQRQNLLHPLELYIEGELIVDNLSVSVRNYIKTVYALSTDRTGARVIDIADKLGVTKASVCVAMGKLEKKGLVYRDNHKLVHLTELGVQQVVLALSKSTIIRQFLVEILGIHPLIASADANAIEPCVSPDTLCGFCRFIRRGCGKCHIKDHSD